MSRNDNLPGMVRHAMRMMVGTLASRILGLVREMLTAALFGATRQLDAFYVAYTLANLSRQLLAEGALSASFVPVFSRTLENKGKDSAQNLARQALSVLLLGGAFVVTVGIIFAPVFVGIMAPGFAAEERALAISLTRIMFPFLLFVSVGALAMGVLNSMGSFFVPAVAPAPGVPNVEVGPYSIIKLPVVGVQFAFAVELVTRVAAEATGALHAIVVIEILNALQFGVGHVSIIRK